MTIKEMQKLYKKVSKVADEYKNARNAVEMSGNYMHLTSVECLDETLDAARRLAKATRDLMFISHHLLNTADLFLEPAKAIVDQVYDEDNFIKWCIRCDVEFKVTEEEAEECM